MKTIRWHHCYRAITSLPSKPLVSRQPAGDPWAWRGRDVTAGAIQSDINRLAQLL
ncbi:hypothetical protein ACLB1Q_19890 [Escherichia coli]